jgi:pentatricopeptide repeat protein
MLSCVVSDVHTYTNLLNAYVRCKEMDGAGRVWSEMINVAHIEPNIVTYTTLIKGYCENDMISTAHTLLLEMLSPQLSSSASACSSSPPLPNHRTLNTFWRGCLRWGNLNSAIQIFNLVTEKEHDHDDNLDPSSSFLDETSYEYLITILCQAFEIHKAVHFTLKYLKLYSTVKAPSNTSLQWLGSEGDSGDVGDYHLSVDTNADLQLLVKMSTSRSMNIDTILNTASIYLNLSRALILSHDYEVGAILLTMTETFIQETKSSSLRLAMDNRRRSEPTDLEHSSRTSGGASNGNSTSSASIILFLQHRSSELGREVTLLKTYLNQQYPQQQRSEGHSHIDSTENILKGYSKTLLLHHLRPLSMNRVEEEQEASVQWKEKLQTGTLTQLNEVFGLKNIFQKQPNKTKLVTRVMKALLSSVKETTVPSVEEALSEEGLPLSTSHDTTSGYTLNFPTLFLQNSRTQKRKESTGELKQRKKKQRRQKNNDEEGEGEDVGDEKVFEEQESEESPLPTEDLEIKMEICSGSGEWLVDQAVEYQRLVNKQKNSTSINSGNRMKPVLWIALELRADRVFQSLCHSILRNATDHVALLGGDASVILPQLIPANSLTTIFINHPEPPERTSGGEDRSQGSHLLTGLSSLLIQLTNE